MDLNELNSLDLESLSLDKLIPKIEYFLQKCEANQAVAERKQSFQDQIPVIKQEIHDEHLLIKEKRKQINQNEIEMLELYRESKQLQDDAINKVKLSKLRTELYHEPFEQHLKKRLNELQLACRATEQRFGFRLKVSNKNADCDGAWLVVFQFSRRQHDELESNNDKFISLKYNETDEQFELIEIHPSIGNFDELRDILAATNDITGLLCTISKNFALNQPSESNI